MHSHISHSSSLSQGSSAVDAQGGLLDSLSDTLLNAFSRVRKPDEKFEGMRERLERLEEGLGGTERVILRSRARHGGEYKLFWGCTKGRQAGPFLNRLTLLTLCSVFFLPAFPSFSIKSILSPISIFLFYLFTLWSILFYLSFSTTVTNTIIKYYTKFTFSIISTLCTSIICV